jgi:hypothetical protein
LTYFENHARVQTVILISTVAPPGNQAALRTKGGKNLWGVISPACPVTCRKGKERDMDFEEMGFSGF